MKMNGVRAGEAVAVDAVVVGHGARPGDRAEPPIAKAATSRTPVQVRCSWWQLTPGWKFWPMQASLVSRKAKVSPTASPVPLSRGGAARVGVHAVAPLVEEHGRELTRVGAAAAGAVEVHRAAVPEGVAGVVDVHVGRERAVEPGVARQEGGGLAVDVRQVVEARAGGMGVARAARRPGVVQSVPPLVPKARLPVVCSRGDGAAGVAHPEVAAVQGEVAVPPE